MSCDLIDDLGRSNAVHLMFEDMSQTNVIVREVSTHCLTVVQAFDDFGDVHARFHIQISERVGRIVEAAGILLLEHIDHLHHDFARSEDLIGLLRWHVVEDVLLVGLVKIVGKPSTQVNEFEHGIVEHDRIKQMTVEMFFRAGHTVRHISTVTQKPELVHGDAGHVLEHVVRDNTVERVERGVLISVGHQERWNRAGEATQMVADAILDAVLLGFLLRGLDFAHHGLASGLDHFAT